MTSPILLTGGTGTLGRLVAPLLVEAGHRVRVLSRSSHPSTNGLEHVVGDLASGDGVEAALRDVETVVHCAGSQRGDDLKASRLVEAAQVAGAKHIVHISVVGADRVPVVSRVDRTMFGYFGAKRAAEEIVVTSGIPWTILRATQFHDLTFMTVSGLAKLPVIPVPSGFSFQPVEAGEVAARLVELALGEPAGLVPDFAGPHVYGMDQLVRSYLEAVGRRRLIVPMRLPGRAAAAFRAGANLAPERAVGRRTWEDFLAARVPETVVARG